MHKVRHRKPIDQIPSSFLVNSIKTIDILDKPILDLACGYGRNGAYLAKQKHRVVFIDNDIECLKFIKEGKNLSDNGDVDINYIRVLKRNLETGTLPFPDQSIAGIIDIHYYNPFLLKDMIRVLDIGGFFCFESIDARGRNINELPDYGFIKSLLKNFDIIKYLERPVELSETSKSTLKIFAIKR